MLQLNTSIIFISSYLFSFALVYYVIFNGKFSEVVELCEE